uniref:GmrSD restriction endonuclease domain-containing protein n=1 Tax=Candidatus Electronema sp. TaxID=2698783 RepID=UPI004057B880
MKRTSFSNESEKKVEIEFNDESLPLDGADDAEGMLIAEDVLMERPFDPTFINIIQKQDTLRNIIERLKNNEIDMNTDFQREGELWDAGKMSRLIESILIRFPLPAFYFDATNDDSWLVVDGLQRLSSIRKFVIEKNQSEKLRLRGLEYLGVLTGKTYDDLPRPHQRRIDECSVTLFLIQPGTPDEVKFSIFRRVNTGGLTLNFQEIRNALTSQILRDYLRELAGDTYMKKTIGTKTKRMQDQELVLRFLAFYTMDYSQSKKNITVFLNEMMKVLEKTS